VNTRRGQVVLAADAAHLYARLDTGRIFTAHLQCRRGYRTCIIGVPRPAPSPLRALHTRDTGQDGQLVCFARLFFSVAVPPLPRWDNTLGTRSSLDPSSIDVDIWMELMSCAWSRRLNNSRQSPPIVERCICGAPRVGAQTRRKPMRGAGRPQGSPLRARHSARAPHAATARNSLCVVQENAGVIGDSCNASPALSRTPPHRHEFHGDRRVRATRSPMSLARSAALLR
jgi:hypothetical protein